MKVPDKRVSGGQNADSALCPHEGLLKGRKGHLRVLHQPQEGAFP